MLDVITSTSSKADDTQSHLMTPATALCMNEEKEAGLHGLRPGTNFSLSFLPTWPD